MPYLLCLAVVLYLSVSLLSSPFFNIFQEALLDASTEIVYHICR